MIRFNVEMLVTNLLSSSFNELQGSDFSIPKFRSWLRSRRLKVERNLMNNERASVFPDFITSRAFFMGKSPK